MQHQKSHTASGLLYELPPSAKLVFKVLEYEGGPFTNEELVAKTRLPERTVRKATRELKNKNIVTTSLTDFPNQKQQFRLSSRYRPTSDASI